MSEDARALEARHVIGAGPGIPVEGLGFEAVRGEGAFVLDAAGRRYLDCASAAALLGHGPGPVADALTRQAQSLTYAPPGAASAVRARTAATLCRLAPGNLERVLFVSSGSEAVESALQIARRFRDRRKVIAFRGGYHGRTYGARSVNGLPPFDRQHVDRVPGTVLCRWGDLDEVRRVLGGDVAAVIVEPVQALQGGRTADAAFVQELEALCRARAAALVLDETLSAPGRAGAPFAANLLGVTPHMITLGGGLAGGAPLGAVLLDRGLSETIQGPLYGSTFGGAPLALAACEATLRAIEEQGLAARAETLGARLRSELCALPGVAAVRGLGLLLALGLEADARAVARDLRAGPGVLAQTSADGRSLLLLPPLTLSDAEGTQLVSALRDVLAAR